MRKMRKNIFSYQLANIHFCTCWHIFTCFFICNNEMEAYLYLLHVKFELGFFSLSYSIIYRTIDLLHFCIYDRVVRKLLRLREGANAQQFYLRLQPRFSVTLVWKVFSHPALYSTRFICARLLSTSRARCVFTVFYFADSFIK